jgi:hypothetical protein
MEKNDRHLELKSLEEIDKLVDVAHVLCNDKQQEFFTRRNQYFFPFICVMISIMFYKYTL